jgi:hypothetical protein
MNESFRDQLSNQYSALPQVAAAVENEIPRSDRDVAALGMTNGA